jgi:hypothetical protein
MSGHASRSTIRRTILETIFIISSVRGAGGQVITYSDGLEISATRNVPEHSQKPTAEFRGKPYHCPVGYQVGRKKICIEEESRVHNCRRVGSYYSRNGELLELGARRDITAKKKGTWRQKNLRKLEMWSCHTNKFYEDIDGAQLT